MLKIIFLCYCINTFFFLLNILYPIEFPYDRWYIMWDYNFYCSVYVHKHIIYIPCTVHRVPDTDHGEVGADKAGQEGHPIGSGIRGIGVRQEDIHRCGDGYDQRLGGQMHPLWGWSQQGGIKVGVGIGMGGRLLIREAGGRYGW